MSSFDRAAGELAAGQHGLLSRRQVHELGGTPAMIRTRLRRGWDLTEPDVFALPGAPETWHRQLLAACLSTGGVASHRSAAALYEILDVERAELEITVPRACTKAPAGVIVHRSGDLHRCAPVDIFGIPTTPPDRLAADLGAVLKPFARFERAVEDLIARRLLTWEEALMIRISLGKQGRNGIGALSALLLERFGQLIPESTLERAFLKVVAVHQLREPIGQLPIFDSSGFIARVDFAYPEHRIVIELDGHRFHADRVTFERDRQKRTRMAAEGWTVLVFTWRMVIDDPEGIARTVLRSLSGASRVA